MWTIYWWEVIDENSDLCGEEFFTLLENADALEHKKYAKRIFSNVKLHCWGMVSGYEADVMGLDTY